MTAMLPTSLLPIAGRLTLRCLAAIADAARERPPVRRGHRDDVGGHRRGVGGVGAVLDGGAALVRLRVPLAPDLAGAVAQAGVDPTLKPCELQTALRRAIAAVPRTT